MHHLDVPLLFWEIATFAGHIGQLTCIWHGLHVWTALLEQNEGRTIDMHCTGYALLNFVGLLCYGMTTKIIQRVYLA